jgi:hypothetical protein
MDLDFVRWTQKNWRQRVIVYVYIIVCVPTLFPCMHVWGKNVLIWSSSGWWLYNCTYMEKDVNVNVNERGVSCQAENIHTWFCSFLFFLHFSQSHYLFDLVSWNLLNLLFIQSSIPLFSHVFHQLPHSSHLWSFYGHFESIKASVSQPIPWFDEKCPVLNNSVYCRQYQKSVNSKHNTTTNKNY